MVPAFYEMPDIFLQGLRGDRYMQLSSKLLQQPKLGRCLFVLGTVCALLGPAALAQNIDEGKSAQRLFADTCVNCHRSANGLAKGRFRPTLFLFLQDHYTASKSEAWELSSYLASVDTPPGARSKKTKTGKRPPAPSAQSN
jgi:mono/diheme cytochrome c family protein